MWRASTGDTLADYIGGNAFDCARIGSSGFGSKTHTLDCLMIGGGPAGLTAAIYFGRFRRDFTDVGTSRASLIPHSHNPAGFPDGISGGRSYLECGRKPLNTEPALCAEQWLHLPDGTFEVVLEGRQLTAKTVLLATGVIDKEPPALPSLFNAVQRA